MRKVVALISAIFLVLAVVIPVSAGNSTIAVSPSVAFGAPFAATYSTNAQNPQVEALCYANSSSIVVDGAKSGDLVWGSWFPANSQNFILGASVSPVWFGGGADCWIGLFRVSGRYLGAQGFQNETLLAQSTFIATP